MQLNADTGSEFVTVAFEPQDVRSFASSWPCFHGPDRVRFTFERDTGDLVDMEPIGFGGRAASVMAGDTWSYFEDHRPDSFGDWLRAELDADQLADLARYGVDASFPGLTYTSDCVALYDRFEDDIRAALEAGAETFGYDSPRCRPLLRGDGGTAGPSRRGDHTTLLTTPGCRGHIRLAW